MSLTAFSALFSAAVRDGEALSVELPDDWLQGRTAYGGLSAALCVEAALRFAADAPPLRSAQFAFIGPASGRLTATPTLLRRGKSSAFVGVDLVGEAGLAVRAILCFAVERASALDHVDLPAPAVPGPEGLEPFFTFAGKPSFSSHFESRLAGGARPMTPGAAPEMVVWTRHRDEAAGAGPTSLMALGDALPPAAMVLFTDRAPISTMTWSIDVLDPNPRPWDGWWLFRSRAATAQAGYSSQAMTLWGAGGRPVLASRQTVAIFA